MGSTMPFSKLQLVDPEHIEAMHAAFRRDSSRQPGRHIGSPEEQITSFGVREFRGGSGRVPPWVRLMSGIGIGIALAVAGWVLLGVTLLAFVGLVAAGLGLTENIDAMADGDVPSKGFDFDREQGA